MSPHYRIQPNAAPPTSLPNNDWSQRYNAGAVPAPNNTAYYQQQATLTPQQQQQYAEMQSCQMELEKLKHTQPCTPEVMQRAEHLRQKIAYLRAQLMQRPPQPIPGHYPMAGYPSANAGPTSAQPAGLPAQSQAQGQPATPTSAVAVLQPGPNQVQVNITPEAPCRTLISVYHQYPAPNVSTNVTTPSISSGKGFSLKFAKF